MVLHQLRDAGNTLVVIEHNLDVIKTADWVIDLGPGGGERGGHIIAEGTPEAICEVPESLTGAYLRPLLDAQAARRTAATRGSRRAAVSGAAVDRKRSAVAPRR